VGKKESDESNPQKISPAREEVVDVEPVA
jgi:hypothetical protein